MHLFSLTVLVQGMGMRDLSKAQQLWQERIEAQRSSGLSITEFCRREGVHKAGFYAWRRRLMDASPEGFVELRVERSSQSTPSPVLASSPALAPAPSAALEVRLVNGRTVLVPEGFDRAHLAKVIAAVEAMA